MHAAAWPTLGHTHEDQAAENNEESRGAENLVVQTMLARPDEKDPEQQERPEQHGAEWQTNIL
jgi:hypothetical protein